MIAKLVYFIVISTIHWWFHGRSMELFNGTRGTALWHRIIGTLTERYFKSTGFPKQVIYDQMVTPGIGFHSFHQAVADRGARRRGANGRFSETRWCLRTNENGKWAVKGGTVHNS